MEKQQISQYLSILKSEISPALGCTEPAAVALAVAYAAHELSSEPISIEVNVSRYIFKNGMNVGIPGTGMIGLDIAVALGALSAAPEKQLLVLNGLSDEQKKRAVELVGEKKIHIGLADN
ncbi:MAG: serine dehydratase subunit alpha family protein, partial [Hydrogeniiclostridium sp.]